MQIALPPYASNGYKFPEEWPNVITNVISHPIIVSYSNIYPILKVIFKTIPIILIISIIIFQNNATWFFNIYFAL